MLFCSCFSRINKRTIKLQKKQLQTHLIYVAEFQLFLVAVFHTRLMTPLVANRSARQEKLGNDIHLITTIKSFGQHWLFKNGSCNTVSQVLPYSQKLERDSGFLHVSHNNVQLVLAKGTAKVSENLYVSFVVFFPSEDKVGEGRESFKQKEIPRKYYNALTAALQHVILNFS